MNLFSIFAISFTIALTGALAPGPLMAFCISESTKHGFKSGPLLILGHAILEIIMVALLVLGFANFIDNPFILKIIGIAGSVILIYFGLNMIFSIPKLSLDFKDDGSKPSNLVLKGITMSLVNPYWAIWWLSIGLSLVLSAKKAGFMALGFFFAGHILADLSWYSIISLTFSKGKNLFTLKAYKRIIFICAITLLGFGVYFGINSFLKTGINL